MAVSILVAGTLAVSISLGLTSSSAADRELIHNGADATRAQSGGSSVTAADGVLAEGTSVFDSSPGVARLDPALLAALHRAAAEADEDGVTFVVNSGWRSTKYQERLFRDAIADHGSEAAAAQWVAPSDRSAHVAGHAVDLAPAAAGWLAEHGAAYGLCQIYDNEPWHFELRTEAVSGRCPERYTDPTEDPRLQP